MEPPDITILYQFGHFLLLLVILNFLLFKPVVKTLTKREDTMASLADGVERAKNDARELEKKYAELAKEKRKPLVEGRDAVISAAHSGAIKQIEKARLELSEELTKVRAEIEKEGKRVFELLKSDVDRLSAEVAEKILKRSL